MSAVFLLPLILILGYAAGSIRVGGISLGASGVLLAALVLGHFGMELPSVIRELGLVCFTAAVGMISGPEFLSHLKKSALGFLLTGALIAAAGGLLCGAAIASGVPTGLAVGLMTGALTSTPGLAMAAELSGDILPTAGYGVAYPFGVVGVVLFVQLMPKLLPIRPAAGGPAAGPSRRKSGGLVIDPHGVFSLALTACLGFLLGKLAVPLPGGGGLSLGTAGGPLVAGLLLGGLRHIGPLHVECPRATLNVVRELGLALFLAGAGLQAGGGFLEILRTYGIGLFLWGAAMTLLPMAAGLLAALRLFRMDPLSALSTVCGGMTSTPALGALIQAAGTDDVASGYAAAYPAALLSVALAVQLLARLG